jgi:predicted amidophosphoribosyltransferase
MKSAKLFGDLASGWYFNLIICITVVYSEVTIAWYNHHNVFSSRYFNQIAEPNLEKIDLDNHGSYLRNGNSQSSRSKSEREETLTRRKAFSLMQRIG